MANSTTTQTVKIRFDSEQNNYPLQVPAPIVSEVLKSLRAEGIEPTMQLRETAAVPEFIILWINGVSGIVTIGQWIKTLVSSDSGKSISVKAGDISIDADNYSSRDIVRIIKELKK